MGGAGIIDLRGLLCSLRSLDVWRGGRSYAWFLCAISIPAVVILSYGGGVVCVEGKNNVDDRIVVYAKPFITSQNSQFGKEIEGTSVDGLGRIYTVAFGGKTWQLGRMSDERGLVDQELFYDGGDTASYYNGIRFLPVPVRESDVIDAAAVVADKKGQVIQVLVRKEDGSLVATGRVFCKDERMIEPNDVAVAYKSGRVYSSGLNYAPTTSHGDGDLWLCKMRPGVSMFSPGLETGSKGGEPVAESIRLNVQGRANGIEVSNDEKNFYAAETWAKDMKIYSNVLWKYDIDQQTGEISNKRLFFSMKEVDEELQGKAGDIDGLRTDMAGNLFLVRNGEPGEVVKVSPAGNIVRRIKLPGITEPTNIELGGPEGTTLFVVGKCKDNTEKACIDIWEGNDATGRAFHNLVRPVPEHDEL